MDHQEASEAMAQAVREQFEDQTGEAVVSVQSFQDAGLLVSEHEAGFVVETETATFQVTVVQSR